MEEDSGDDSQAQDLNEEEDNIFSRPITDDFYNEICTTTTTTIKSLQSNQQYNLAEEVQKLLMALQNIKGSLDGERVKNTQMQEQVDIALGKVSKAYEISQIDQDTIAKLKLEIESSWKQTDAAQTREQTAQEHMYEMREKLEKLQSDARETEKKDASDELGASLVKHRETILRERDRLNAEVEELKKRLQIQRLYADEMEKKRTESENKNKELYKLLDATSSEAFKEKRLLDQLKVDFEEMSQIKTDLAEECKYFKNQVESLQTTATQLNTKIATLRSQLDKANNTIALTNAKLLKTSMEYKTTIETRDKLQMEMSQKSTFLKLKESECKKLFIDNNQIIKSREILQKKIMMIETAKGDLTQEVLKMKNTILTFEKERDGSTKSFEKIKKIADDLLRERDLVQKDLQRANRFIGEQKEIILMNQQQIKNLDNDIKQHLAAAQKQKSIIAKVEKERDRNAEEIQVLADKIEQVQDELFHKINQITELKQNIDELKGKLAQIQQLFEVARTERNAFQRDLLATSEDRDDVRDRLRIASGQIDQLKEDIDVKESELLRANKQIEKLEKEKIALKLEIQNTNIILQHTRTELKEKKMDNERLYKTLTDDEMKLMQLRKDLDTAQNEKDLIGTQMIRKNDEIGLLNEKINIIQTALDRGEAQYNKRLDDIRLLKIEIGNLISQRNLLTRGHANTADMRQEVLQLNRILTQERVRAKALEQEMMTPMNVHRWRKLGGQDPDKMDLIFKLHSLQKRILNQSASMTEKEMTLEESQKLYSSLKQFMTKLPNHTIKEKLRCTQRTLGIKTKKLKALKAELTAHESDVKIKDCTIEEYKELLHSAKLDLLKEKKDKQKLKEKLDGVLSQHIISISPSAHRTLGSGFKIPTNLQCPSE